MADDQIEYRMHEGALLRSGPGCRSLVEVWFPKSRRWSPTGYFRDWVEGRPLTEEEAKVEMEEQSALYERP